MKKLILSLVVFIVAEHTMLCATIIPTSQQIIYLASKKLQENQTTEMYDYTSSGLRVNNFNASIVSHTFTDGQGIITFDSDLTHIGNLTFYGCSQLSKIYVPSSVTNIESSAFAISCGACCNSLVIVMYQGNATGAPWEGDACFMEEDDHYYYCDTAKTIVGRCKHDTISSFNIPDQVTQIAEGAFAFTSFTNPLIVIPDRINTIGSNAFANGRYGICYWEYTNSDYTLLYAGDAIGAPWGAKVCYPAYDDDYFYNNSTKTILAKCRDTTVTNPIIPQDIVTIAENAFEGCANISAITFPTSVSAIGAKAFGGCRKLYNIYCYAAEPPVAQTSSFENYNVYLRVPCDNLQDYQMDAVFGSFKYIECIGADETPVTSVTIVPNTNSVEITWPKYDQAANYTIEIKKDGVVFCTLTFNAQGQLKSIAFAPGRDGGREMLAAVETSSGYKFTITGLNPSTAYTYNIDTKNASGATLANYTGQFTTTNITALNQLSDSPSDRFTKVMKDGQLLILREGKMYNAQGGEVR